MNNHLVSAATGLGSLVFLVAFVVGVALRGGEKRQTGDRRPPHEERSLVGNSDRTLGTFGALSVPLGFVAVVAGILALCREDPRSASYAIAGIVMGSPVVLGVALLVALLVYLVVTKPLKNARWG